MEFSELVRMFSDKLGLSVPKSDEAGRYAFSFAADILVFLQVSPDKSQFYLSNVVCIPPLAVKDRRAILAICLEANFFGQGTNGATFAFDRSTQELIFFRAFNAKRCTFPVFLNALNDMAFHVREWRRRFEAKDYYGTWRQGYRGLGESDIQSFWQKI